MRQFLDFEKSIAELETKIDELRRVGQSDAALASPSNGELGIDEEISRLSDKAAKRLRAVYSKLTPHQKVQVARHAQRPHALDYIKALMTDFVPLAGDRAFGDDQALIGGLARFKGRSVVVLGTERGADTESRLKHNFGMARPEGYRKAQRLMKLAARFNLPLISFVDTAGAWPGIDAEARGQAQAIASSIDVELGLDVPTIAVVIGEGGSGGAIALAAADRVLMLEHAIYSVISPEAAASILWRDPKLAPSAAEALKLTAQDLKKLGLIDRIIPEPLGGAQRDRQNAMERVGQALEEELHTLADQPRDERIGRRRERFLGMTRP
ncbi:acetyl-CoA carboxylase carboxyltransferase subunit alpha [Formicincola oecophyllae]|uniref:Acetyl-coenzyme A carboxylase carboxyl transferase subunit alpha n=1 Tax=Formicincola oecophyllae TaxID=2558361 RepID=A0A4Y6U8T6_9PROT|nr:acetyl-CoA carboxylase carboxyltransferase subunit alpha [Formicincola oecophyllae]QDH13873.1 acetyl-CoA carboxylase carboxyltransferase subunit alpha [Formicincola oecophyllae]